MNLENTLTQELKQILGRKVYPLATSKKQGQMSVNESYSCQRSFLVTTGDEIRSLYDHEGNFIEPALVRIL